jgi:hypothetical protein
MRTGFTAFSALLLFAVQATAAPKPSAPSNGPKATVIRDTNLYVGPDEKASRLAEISPGREMVIVEKNGPWLRVFANTDEETSRAQDAPVFGHDAAAVPISGWMSAAGVISAETASRSPGIRPGCAAALPAHGRPFPPIAADP